MPLHAILKLRRQITFGPEARSYRVKLQKGDTKTRLRIVLFPVVGTHGVQWQGLDVILYCDILTWTGTPEVFTLCFFLCTFLHSIYSAVCVEYFIILHKSLK